jgi:hypothetical protein
MRKSLIIVLAVLGVLAGGMLVQLRDQPDGHGIRELSAVHIAGTENADPYAVGLSLSTRGNRLVYMSTEPDPRMEGLSRSTLSSVNLSTDVVTKHVLDDEAKELDNGFAVQEIDCCLGDLFDHRWSGNIFYLNVGRHIFEIGSGVTIKPVQGVLGRWECSDCPDSTVFRAALAQCETSFGVRVPVDSRSLRTGGDGGELVSLARESGIDGPVFVVMEDAVQEFFRGTSRTVFDMDSRVWEKRISMIRVSPTGRFLAVVRTLRIRGWFPRPQSGEELYVVDLRRGTRHRVAKLKQIGGAVWSPDGSTLYFCGSGTERGIFRVAIDPGL